MLLQSQQYKQIKIRPERLRKIINFIRLNDFVPCLCSTSKGYFIAHTNEELHEYIKSLNPAIGSWPVKFKNEDEKMQVQLHWSNSLWNAKEYYIIKGESSKSLYLLSELYRQGHNMDINDSGKLASFCS